MLSNFLFNIGGFMKFTHGNFMNLLYTKVIILTKFPRGLQIDCLNRKTFTELNNYNQTSF